jgi:hypothetical protein
MISHMADLEPDRSGLRVVDAAGRVYVRAVHLASPASHARSVLSILAPGLAAP